MVARIIASVACLSSLASAFLHPTCPSARLQSNRLYSTTDKKEPVVPIAWEEDNTHRVSSQDRFVVRSDIKDYAKLTEEQMKAHEKDGAVRVEKSHQSFIPHSHAFAHARLLNVVCRVSNIDKTVKFYEALGFIPLREKITPQYSSVVMGFGSEEYGQNVAIQFVQEGGGSLGRPLDLGDGYLGATVTLPNIKDLALKAQSSGGRVVSQVNTYEYPATQVPDQDAEVVNKETKAVVADPDGYKVILVEGEIKDKLTSLTLRVYDEQKATAFYGKMGMKVLKKRANVPVETSSSTWVGYDDDHVYTMGFVHEKLKQAQFHMFKVPSTTLELKYEYDSQPVRQGAMAQVVVGVYKGVKAAFDAVRSAGGKIVKNPSSEEGQDVAAIADPDGYTITLVDIEQFNTQLV